MTTGSGILQYGLWIAIVIIGQSHHTVPSRVRFADAELEVSSVTLPRAHGATAIPGTPSPTLSMSFVGRRVCVLVSRWEN